MCIINVHLKQICILLHWERKVIYQSKCVGHASYFSVLKGKNNLKAMKSGSTECIKLKNDNDDSY